MAFPTGLAAKPELPQAVFTDFSSLDGLRGKAGEGPRDSGEAEQRQLREAAKQFSSIFLHMALKSMREASFGGGILDSQQSEFYRDMFDQQIALDLGQGEGFGLTQIIVDQLSPQPPSHKPLTSTTEKVATESSAVASQSAAEAYSRVAKESAVSADTESSGQISATLDGSSISVEPDANLTSRLALP